MRRLGSWCRGWVLAVALVGGCDVFDPDLLPRPGDPGGDDGSIDPQDTGTTNPEDGCLHGTEVPPQRPPPETEGPDIGRMVFALKDVVLSNANAGLNVDGVCSDREGPWRCLPERQLARYRDGEQPRVHVDGPRGIDNQFALSVFDTVDFAFRISDGQNLELTSQTAEAHGYGNPLIIITDYNGEANDPSVTVVVTQSVFGLPSDDGAQPDPCILDTENGGVPHERDAGGECDWDSPISPLPVTLDDDENPTEIVEVHPGWETGDLWFWARDDTFINEDEDRPAVEVDTAYVNDYQLVVRLPDNQVFNLVGEGQAVQARLQGAYAVADLRPDFSGTDPHKVLIAGRWAITALLETAGSVGICPGDPLYSTADGVLRDAADVRTSAADEGLDVPCNAVSFGITFTAHRANMGGLALGQPIPEPCAQDDGGDAGVGGGD
jgi:hypothetical protein